MGNISSSAVNTTKDIRAKLARNDIQLLQQAVAMDSAAPAPVVRLSKLGEVPTDEAAATQVAQWLLMRDGLETVLVEAMNASGLASLEVNGPRITGTAAVLRQCPRLQCLALRCGNQRDGGQRDIQTKPLISALEVNTTLRSLEIEVVWGYTHAACNDMLRAIKRHPGLTLLALKGSRGVFTMDLQVHGGLLDFVRGATALQTLKLEGVSLGVDIPATIKLFEALADNTHVGLSALSLSCNELREEVAPALIACLARSRHLMSLDISLNPQPFLKLIVQFLAQDRCSVRSLSLGMASRVVSAVALMIETNKTLKVLSLTSRRSMYHMDAMQTFHNQLANNNTLECLVLEDSGDVLEDDGPNDELALLDALERNTSLLSIVFGWGILGTAQLARAEAIVTRNRDRKAKAAYVRGGVVGLTTRYGLPAEVSEYLAGFVVSGTSTQAIDQARTVIAIDRKTSAAAFEQRSRTHASQLVDALGNANYPLVESLCRLLKDCDMQMSRADLDLVLHEAKSRPGIPQDVITNIEAIGKPEAKISTRQPDQWS